MGKHRYSFFIIIDTKTQDFQVFYTVMKDWRLRLSAMRSAFKRWSEQNLESTEFPYREYYGLFKLGYDVAYVIDKGTFTETEAEHHRGVLTQTYVHKSL